MEISGQCTSQMLMIRPVNFNFNPETAGNNSFQKQQCGDDTETSIQSKALLEFDAFVNILALNGVEVTVVEDTVDPPTPDSIFPNNWISFHSDGTVCLFPMYAKNRRLERKPAVFDVINQKFKVERILDFTFFEASGKCLEGTGSMVIDHGNRIIYASRSARFDEEVLNMFVLKMGYDKCVVFDSRDSTGTLIYHTNVMMAMGDRFVVICLDAILDVQQREYVKSTLEGSGKEIVEITMLQMNKFAGNMLQVQNSNGNNLLVMSTRALKSLTVEQCRKLETYNTLIHSDLTTIEDNGGGSARCMMAEIYLEKNISND